MEEEVAKMFHQIHDCFWIKKYLFYPGGGSRRSPAKKAGQAWTGYSSRKAGSSGLKAGSSIEVTGESELGLGSSSFAMGDLLMETGEVWGKRVWGIDRQLTRGD